MKSQGTFPRKQSEKNEYYIRVIAYLIAEQLRLGITAGNITFITGWIVTWNDVYPKAVDESLTTKPLRDQKDAMIIQIENRLRGIYDDIPGSVLTDTDRLKLNLPARDAILTARPKIDATPYIKALPRSGALVEFITRKDTDSTRPSILDDADGVEFVFNIGGTQPVSPSECTKNFFSTKAKFKVQMDVADAGKKVQGFAYWKNTSDSAKSGPPIRFSVMITE